MTMSSCGAPESQEVGQPQLVDAPTRAHGAWLGLVRLFIEAGPHNASHWNTRTGQTFCAPRGNRRGEAVQQFTDRLMREPDWLEVPYLESDDAYAMAQAFVAGLAPGRGRTALQRALAADKPFRAFRAILGSSPGLSRRWGRLQQQEAALRLVGLCLDLGMTLLDKDFRRYEAQLAEAEPLELTFERSSTAAPIRRSVASLSIGKPCDEDDLDDLDSDAMLRGEEP